MFSKISISITSYKFFIITVGIIICYTAHGILQEDILKTKYGKTEESFKYYQIVCAVCYFFSFIVGEVGHLVRKEAKDESSTWLYIYTAIVFFLGELLSTVALKWVSYPILIVSKSARPLPTIILTVIIGRARYHWRKYLFVTLIVIGVAMFMLNDQSSDTQSEKLWWGEILLVVSLIIDGICNGLQERIRNVYTPTAFSMMLKVNGWSFLINGIAATVSGEVQSFFYFSQRHPEVVLKILMFGIVGAFGQIFIYYMISLFGTLSCSIVTTIRKFFTIVISVLINANPLMTHQWIGATIVFASVLADVFYGNGSTTDSSNSDDKSDQDLEKEVSYRPNEAIDSAIRTNSIYIMSFEERNQQTVQVTL